MPTALSTHRVSKTFRDANGERIHALQDISVEIRAGEFFVFVGPSGCGKSTLLRIMSGLEHEYDGEIRLDPDIRPRDVSFVFQQFALLPWLTVAENIEMGVLASVASVAERRSRVKGELERFGLDDFACARPRELSGGMKQRVGIARAFVCEPKIIFMDEPFSELDSFMAAELRKEFLHLWKESGETVVMVTHLIPEALELADRIAVMTPGPGRIEKIVTNVLPRPRAKRSPEFFRLEDELYKLIKP